LSDSVGWESLAGRIFDDTAGSTDNITVEIDIVFFEIPAI
jgi:hypothetical protein